MIGLLGDRRSSRGTAATLHYSGHAELIASTPAEYVKNAVELANDPVRLSRYRSSFREQPVTICNGPYFTQSLESTYRELWRTSWKRVRHVIRHQDIQYR